jgi:tetratricopeptide (TPR) repeat protein
MNRVQAALQEGRCVLAIGGRALQSAELLGELRRRSVPSVALGAGPVNPVSALTADHLAPAIAKEGGLIVLVEPEGSDDGKALTELANLLKGKKPKILVAAKAFNPFTWPASLRLLKVEHLKMRGLDFITALPVAEVAAPAPAPAPVATPFAIGGAHAAPAPRKEVEKVNAPRPDVVGRVEELAALGALLGEEGGPIVVVGPSGVGRRWLVEKALEGKDRFPDFAFGRGMGFDCFMTRLAFMAKSVGDDRLATALAKVDERPSPAALAALAVEVAQAEGFKGKNWVLHRLPLLLDRRDNSFYHDGRLEMVLRALFTAPLALTMVFISDRAPMFYREGQGKHLRTLPVAGIKGRELHELFAIWRAPEFPRDRFGQINERTHGHALANRFLAITVREEGDIDALLEQPKLLRADSVTDVEALRRHLKRRVEGLDEATKGLLMKAALLREPGSADDLQILGLSRNDRLSLLAAGLLEQTPHADDRKYYVHPLVSEHLDGREVANFDAMELFGAHLITRARELKEGKGGKTDIVGALALGQEANRLYVEARKARDRMGMPFADNDAIVDNIRGILRQKKPRYDIARIRINEALKTDAKNTELLLLDAELKDAEKAGAEVITAAYDNVAAVAPTPEVFHASATWNMHRNARGKASAALEAGVAAFPEDARLHRRLATTYMHQNRLLDAVDILKKARDLEPMMPDAYGALGEIYTQLGVDRWADAEASIEEALRLDADSPQHLLRLAALLRRKAMVDLDKKDELLASAEEKARAAYNADKNSARAMVELGAILLDRGGDVEQAQWFLQNALKKGESPEAFVHRARVLIRQKQWSDADALIERAIKKEPSNHAAFAAKAELAIDQGDAFRALESLKIAKERSPRNGPERIAYERLIAQVSAIIESGQAANLMRSVEEGGEEAPAAEPAAEGPRRDAASTTRRRRRGGRKGEGAAAEEAPATEEAPAAEESPVAEEAAPAAEEAPAAVEG